jgi:hypothetical protein
MFLRSICSTAMQIKADIDHGATTGALPIIGTVGGMCISSYERLPFVDPFAIALDDGRVFIERSVEGRDGRDAFSLCNVLIGNFVLASKHCIKTREDGTRSGRTRTCTLSTLGLVDNILFCRTINLFKCTSFEWVGNERTGKANGADEADVDDMLVAETGCSEVDLILRRYGHYFSHGGWWEK